jgi:hypothetical protein
MSKRLSTTHDERHDDSISLQLNGNKLIMNDSGSWIFESSDLDNATFEIEKLVNEKVLLIQSLSNVMKQVDDLKQEVTEANEIKTGMLEMLMIERQKRISLETEVGGYKAELHEAYKVIVELRRHLPK